MKFDIDHSTPYFRSIFGNMTEEAMVDNIEVMKSLSTYHKKNHYLLNNGAKNEYNPPSWSDSDNIFPLSAPTHPMTHIEWAAYIRAFDKDNTKGDVLEFGVACAGTIRDIAFIPISQFSHISLLFLFYICLTLYHCHSFRWI